MILDSSASQLLQQYEQAKGAEGEAVKALLAALRAGARDTTVLEALTKAMEDSHGYAMSIYAQLESVRLDK